MSKLISKGNSSIYGIDFFLEKYNETNNFDFLEKACFEIQQTLEFLLKGTIELFGERYKFGHKFAPNIELLDYLMIDNDVDNYDEIEKLRQELYEKYQYVLNNEDEIYSWEAKSRYEDGFFVSKDKVMEVYNVCVEINNLTQKLYQEFDRLEE